MAISVFANSSFSSCIRFSVVEELAGLGATVHMCARNGELLHERIQEWKSKGFEVSGSVCDLTSKDQREELIRTVSSVFHGKLNILVSLFHCRCYLLSL